MEYVKGLVSVVIPTYKRSEMLLKSIEAVLNQTYDKIELFVVNDNIPGDNYSKALYNLLESIRDDRLHLVEQKEHINGAAARNAGIREARGEFIAFQDDDDYWELNKIERQVELLSSLDDSWGAVSCLKRIYKNGKLIEATRPYKSGELLQKILDGRVSLGTGAVLIRRKALDQSGYFDESLIRHQDLQLFARLASKYKIKLEKKYYQNREISDNQNRANANKLVQIKKAYLCSIDDLLEKSSPLHRKAIYGMHSFDLAYAFLKEGNKKEFLKRFLKIFNSPYSLYVAICRVINRFIETKLKNHLVKKYSD